MAKHQKVRVCAAVTTSGTEYIIGDANLGTSRFVTLSIEKDYRDKDNNPDVPGILLRIAMTETQFKKLMSHKGHEVVASLDTYDGESFPIPRASSTGAIKDAEDKIKGEIKEKLTKAMSLLVQSRDVFQNSKASRKDISEASSLLNNAVTEISKNIPYLMEVGGHELTKISEEAVDNTTEAIQDYLKGLGIRKHKGIVKNATKKLKGGNDENTD